MSRAFLLGAGVTKAAYPNAPLSNDFFAILRAQHLRLYEDVQKSITRYHYEIAKLYEANIEAIMELSYQFDQSAQNFFLSSIYTAIYELLAAETESTAEIIKPYLFGNTGLQQRLLKTLLKDHRLKDDDFFITLNYDLYLDREVMQVLNQKSINYGIKKDFLRLSGDDLPLMDKPVFSIYHLHGSLNWEIIGERVQVHWGAIRPRDIRGGSNVCIVPPGLKELTPFLRSIWETAENRLKNADELIIIGCSLNPKDKELISLIQKGPKKLKIIYLDKSLSKMPYAQLKEINHHSDLDRNFKPYPYGFNLHGPGKKPGAIEFIFS